MRPRASESSVLFVKGCIDAALHHVKFMEKFIQTVCLDPWTSSLEYRMKYSRNEQFAG